MIKMTSDRPLLIRGEAVTEFETDEQHAKELEIKGLATRAVQAGPPPSVGSAVASRPRNPRASASQS